MWKCSGIFNLWMLDACLNLLRGRQRSHGWTVNACFLLHSVSSDGSSTSKFWFRLWNLAFLGLQNMSQKNETYLNEKALNLGLELLGKLTIVLRLLGDCDQFVSCTRVHLIRLGLTRDDICSRLEKLVRFLNIFVDNQKPTVDLVHTFFIFFRCFFTAVAPEVHATEQIYQIKLIWFALRLLIFFIPAAQPKYIHQTFHLHLCCINFRNYVF